MAKRISRKESAIKEDQPSFPPPRVQTSTMRLACPHCLEELLYYDYIRRLFICLNPKCQKRYALVEYNEQRER